MRIVLTTHGAMGEVQPFLALAAELQRAGHQPVLAFPSNLLPYAQQHGFESYQIGPNIDKEMQQYIRLISQDQATEEDHLAYSRTLATAAPYALQDLHAQCANADVLISNVSLPLGRIMHELTGIPFVSLEDTYIGALNEAHTNPEMDLRDTSTAARSIHELFNTFLGQLGLQPTSNYYLYCYSPQLALFTLSREVLRPNPAWPKHYHVAGHFFLEEDEWQPNPDLVSFLRAGPPPIVISLGSMMHDDPAELTELLVTAVNNAGCRAIMQHGWTGLARSADVSNTIYTIDYVPHNWLFPQAACVVHHGGVGTTAAALRAAVPMVLIPHLLDNAAMAHRIAELGCAGAVIPYPELNAKQLSEAIAQTLTNPGYRIAANALSVRIQAEQGVQSARVLIEQMLNTEASESGAVA